MIGTVSWFIAALVICEGRHWDADRMLPNERSRLDDCRSRFHELIRNIAPSPASGTIALLKEFAHMGAIGWTKPDGAVSWNCGGTLIWPDYVLTAAHCVVDHRNVRPDIVRLGDLNLESDDDNQHAQQLKIAQIFRYPLHRFGVKYHDIALIKLEKPVRVFDTVCPACLWLDSEIRFTELVATGWGSIGHNEGRTPSLLKVSLKPMENSLCDTFYANGLVRGLNSGLHENHLCAQDEKMDTCEGDSGGPLQVKLLHDTYLTPFIVAITSFGLPCGLSKPGVYTKIAPYRDWIVATMRQSGATIEDDIFNSTLCAVRFQMFREDIYSTPFNSTHVNVYHGAHEHIYEAESPSYLVKLLWNGTEGLQHCYGTIIDENTVLTVAECAYYHGIPTSSVQHPEGIIDVSKVNVHPKYNPSLGYNNIAILRLEKLFSFQNIRPACIEYNSMPWVDTAFGIGREDLYKCGSFPECIGPSLIHLTVYTQPKNETNCLISRKFKPRFPNGLTSELVCFGIDQFLVPGACDLKIGSTLSQERSHGRTKYPPLGGLVHSGRDCGYGEHLLATSVHSHVTWMERVLLPKATTTNAVQFLDPSRHVGDSCTDEYELPGVCTPVSRCQRKWKKFEHTKEAAFCASTSVICCPQVDIDKDAWGYQHSLLAKCPKLVNSLIAKMNGAEPMVRILDSFGQYICMGAIISDRTILTSASCVGNGTSFFVQPLTVLRAVMRVQKVIPHKSYNSTDYSNDIALLRLIQTFTWTSGLFPVCLWNNRTHSPLIVEMLNAFNTHEVDTRYVEVLTMYNSDCQRTHAYQLRDSHICVKHPYVDFTCLLSHSMLWWTDPRGVPYLIGLSTDTRECQSWYYMTFSRIAAFLDWIADNIDDVEISRSFGSVRN